MQFSLGLRHLLAVVGLDVHAVASYFMSSISCLEIPEYVHHEACGWKDAAFQSSTPPVICFHSHLVKHSDSISLSPEGVSLGVSPTKPLRQTHFWPTTLDVAYTAHSSSAGHPQSSALDLELQLVQLKHQEGSNTMLQRCWIFIFRHLLSIITRTWIKASLCAHRLGTKLVVPTRFASSCSRPYRSTWFYCSFEFPLNWIGTFCHEDQTHVIGGLCQLHQVEPNKAGFASLSLA